ncbi:MAG TPA: hypothetical protein ENH29_02995 [Bacteroidetes bacterium]|nr:hypothetical protein [Bacteroidota bacterium]
MNDLVCKLAKLIWVFSLSGLFFFAASSSFGQIQRIKAESKTIEGLQQEKMNLDKKIARKLKILKKKSAEISRIKSDKSGNYFRKRKLQSLLQESKEIADQLNRLQAEREKLQNELNVKTNAFRKFLDAELLATFRTTKRFNNKSPDYKNGVKKLSRLFELRAKYLPQNRAIPDYSGALMPVLIDAQDDSQTVEEKIDMLKDQEDYLHSISLIMKEKIKTAKEWAGLTQVAGDLLEDIQVQQTRDETIGKANALTTGETRALGLTAESDLVKNAGMDQGNILIPVELENILSLKPEQLSGQISKLEQMGKRIRVRADSLAEIIRLHR